MIKALIFDMDGTMVDNMGVHCVCWQKVLEKYGLPLSLEEVTARCTGKNSDIIERLFPGQYSHEEAVRIAEEKEALYREVFSDQLALVAGLPEFLERNYQAGIPMGIGTAAPPENVNYVLDQLNIRHYFQTVITADDVVNGKPAPDVFFKVAQNLGVAPEHCLVFEDSPTGAKTALNAGMKAIIVTGHHTENEFEGIPGVIKFVADFNGVGSSDFSLT